MTYASGPSPWLSPPSTSSIASTPTGLQRSPPSPPSLGIIPSARRQARTRGNRLEQCDVGASPQAGRAHLRCGTGFPHYCGPRPRRRGPDAEWTKIIIDSARTCWTDFAIDTVKLWQRNHDGRTAVAAAPSKAGPQCLVRRIADFAPARLDATPVAGSLCPPTPGFNLSPLRVGNSSPHRGSRQGGRGGEGHAPRSMVPAGLSAPPTKAPGSSVGRGGAG